MDPIEHLVASMLDVNKDGTLSDEEKANAAALIEKLRKHYITGLEVRCCSLRVLAFPCACL